MTPEQIAGLRAVAEKANKPLDELGEADWLWAHEAFGRATTPDVVLGLLGEIERLKARNNRLSRELTAWKRKGLRFK